MMKEARQEHPAPSRLDAGQLALLASAGARVLGLVTATYAYHRRPPAERTQSGEMKGWGGTERRAYAAVLARMQARARAMGAGGVVAATFVLQPRPWEKDLFELTCQGTALGLPEQAATDTPFVCALSGAEVLCLRQAGYVPAGHVVGLCAFYQVTHLQIEMLLRSGVGRPTPNVERSDFTRGYYAARSGAMRRLEEEAEGLGAVGVIGIRVEARPHYHDLRSREAEHVERQIFEFTAQGTALRAVAPAGTPPVRPIVSLHT